MVLPRYTIRHLSSGNDSINRHRNCRSTASTCEGKQPSRCELTQVIEGILSHHDCIQAAVDDECLHEETNEDGCHDVSFGIYILHEVKQLRNDLRDEERAKCSYTYSYRRPTKLFHYGSDIILLTNCRSNQRDDREWSDFNDPANKEH